MTTFFGRRWDAPKVDDAIQRPVPVGQRCGYCSEPIERSDSGTFMPFILDADRAEVRPIHLECDMRAALGGIGHWHGHCRCHGEPGADPDEGLPYRESARQVLAEIERMRGRSIFERTEA